MNPISCTRRSPPPPHDLSPNWPLILEGGAGGGRTDFLWVGTDHRKAFFFRLRRFRIRVSRSNRVGHAKTHAKTHAIWGGGGRVTSCHWYEAASNELVLYYQVTHGEVTTRQRLKAISWNRRKEVVTPR